MEQGPMRIDLHVHSKFSTRPSQWILQKLGCPESFTEPHQIYHIAKTRGMTLVTITDHNRIDGALEIAHLPDAFVSEEITTYFPEDRCKIHVLALNIDEAQHRDIQKARENIYELVDYLLEAGIFHILAHPLFSVNGRLTITHFEKLLLLFKNFEMNGARNDQTNECLHYILRQLTPADIDRLADTHGIVPRVEEPWRKSLTGGSDDHSSLNIARTHTEIPDAHDLADALAGILDHRARVVRHPSTPLGFARNIYSIGYQFYRHRLHLERYTGKDILLNFLDRCLLPENVHSGPGFMAKLYDLWHYRKRPRLKSQVPESLAAFIRHESGKLLHENPQLLQITEVVDTQSDDLDKILFRFVNHVSNRALLNVVGNLMDNLSGANVFNVFQTIGSAGGLYALLAPFFISFTYFAQDREFNRRTLAHFNRIKKGERSDGPEDLAVTAHFTDRLHDLNRVQLSLQRLTTSKIANPRFFKLITCDAGQHRKEPGIRSFEPIGTYEHPDFPGNRLFFPPLMEILNYCYTRKVTHLHSATMGPVGLAALAVARILKLPVYGACQHALSGCFTFLGEDESVSEVLNRFQLWYYDQLDRVYVFCEQDAAALRQMGVQPGKIRTVPHCVDLRRFHPGRRNGYLNRHCGSHANLKILCDATSATEKRLALLTEVFKILSRVESGLHLIVTGAGSMTAGLRRIVGSAPCTFLERPTEEEWPGICASSDIFICGGRGQAAVKAVSEAQASGVPVIAEDLNQLKGCISPERSGFLVRPKDADSLYEALQRLISSEDRRRRMGRSARQFAESSATIWTAFADPDGANPSQEFVSPARLARGL
ncbi:MAG: glycosyltransferase [Desulfobacterales bacterium]|jgi:glycosyltransferase involved in cell wall biosynthesis